MMIEPNPGRAQALEDAWSPEVRRRLGEPRWFRRHWSDEYPDQKPPKSAAVVEQQAKHWPPAARINQAYEAFWGDHKAVLIVVGMHFGWTPGQAYQATEDWFRDPVNYN